MEEEEFDFEEIIREADNKTSARYHDEAMISRNFILKLRKLLKSKNMNAEEFRTEVARLNSKLKFRQMQHLEKHLGLVFPQKAQ